MRHGWIEDLAVDSLLMFWVTGVSLQRVMSCLAGHSRTATDFLCRPTGKRLSSFHKILQMIKRDLSIFADTVTHWDFLTHGTHIKNKKDNM